MTTHGLYCQDNVAYRQFIGETLKVLVQEALGVQIDLQGTQSDLQDLKAVILEEYDIIAENIAAGVEVLGVEGTFTADADATAGDIALGKTAYVNGVKIIGTLE